MSKCPLVSELKKKGRGAFNYRIRRDRDLILCKWWDNKALWCRSNYLGMEPADQCSRFDRIKKATVNTSRPAVISIYSTYMGVVDKTNYIAVIL